MPPAVVVRRKAFVKMDGAQANPARAPAASHRIRQTSVSRVSSAAGM